MALFMGTPAGLYCLPEANVALRTAQMIGLHGNLITHVAVAGDCGMAAHLLPPPLHWCSMYSDHLPLNASQASGLHLLRQLGPFSTMPASAPAFSSQHVWAGDTRSCCIWDIPGGAGAAGAWAGGPWPAAAGAAQAGSVGLAVGTEPADVYASLDGGHTWSPGTGSFALAPSRKKWSFPAPPHVPHTLSFERIELRDGGPHSKGGGGGGGGDEGGLLVAGIEVGGVMASTVSGAFSSGNGSSWHERGEGLYADVHSCRVDPHDQSNWLAVTGRGLYASHDAGASWQQQGSWAGRYTVGLAFNPQVEGEVLVAAGDSPPANGAHVMHSVDGGVSWRDITAHITKGPCAELLGTRTPVPYFWAGRALLGTSTGALLGAADADRREWRQVDQLPVPIVSMAAPGQCPSSVMH